jgi:hypothetical protein
MMPYSSVLVDQLGCFLVALMSEFLPGWLIKMMRRKALRFSILPI